MYKAVKSQTLIHMHRDANVLSTVNTHTGVWFFEAQKPFNWRYYCQSFTVKTKTAQTITSDIINKAYVL